MIPTDEYFGKIAEAIGMELLKIDIPRATRVGNSIIQSDVRVGKAEISDAADQSGASTILLSIVRDSEPGEDTGLIAGIESLSRKHEVWLGIPEDHTLSNCRLPAKLLYRYEDLDALLAS